MQPPTKEQVESNCASCHSRREELTGEFRAGDNYFDHYRPTLVDAPGVFHADGQVLDEDFEFGSFLTSRMYHKGVSCKDCHNPHTGKLLLPIENNALCMSCHGGEGRNQAIPIDPAKHMLHKEGTPGGRCVDCHMAQNTYMQRDPRRDHGFICPDPLLTKTLGIPNSCNRCHTDKSVDWAIEETNKGYGDKMNRRARARAIVVDRAKKMDEKVLPELVEMARTEEVAGWKAGLIRLLYPWAGEPSADAIFKKYLDDPHPLVRAAAVRGLTSKADLEKGFADPLRVVRLDAFQASIGTPVTNDSVRSEYLKHLAATHDQPGGAFAEANLALTEGRSSDAEAWALKGAQWDHSSGSSGACARILHSLGKDADAEKAFITACELDPKNAQPVYVLALFYGETQNIFKAIESFQTAVTLDPQFGRAWYNLGLACSQGGKDEAALAALGRASELMTDSPEPAYARATIFARLGRIAEARDAAKESLKRAPGYTPAGELLKALDRQPAPLSPLKPSAP